MTTISRGHLLLSNRNLASRRRTVLRHRLNTRILCLRHAINVCLGLKFSVSAGFSSGLRVDIHDRWWRAKTTTLNVPHDQDNPERELQDSADGNAGDSSIPFAIVTGAVVVVVEVGVGTVDARAPGAEEATADDEEEDGGTEETDGPPV
jgi:hypothetical protein